MDTAREIAPAPAALSPRAAAQYIGGVSRATLYRWARAGRIAAPITLSPGRAAWLRADLDRFLAACAAARDAAR